MTRRLARIEVVEDRTASSRCDEGFLRLRRLRLRNVYEDGSASESYAYDVASRKDVDAVAIVLHDRDAEGRVRVALRVGPRPPITLRAERRLPHDDGTWGAIPEIVAGVLEEEDTGPDGIERRAAAECEEEAGVRVAPGKVEALGGASFASPGVTDERVHFRHVAAPLDQRGEAKGDGSVVERDVEVVLLPLREAIRRCRAGEIPDMKTEVALLRLCDALGYLPAFDRFLGEMPKRWQAVAGRLPRLL